ncbi:MAG: OmpH family outer membrane protein [Saprospiraceae bacterium]|nr:OmpH family outer membrane protein [Saprospiraceae bacterium]
MKNIFLLLFTFLSISVFGQQKFGHLNTGNLLELMPESKSANEQLQVFQSQLSARGETMAKMLEDKIVRYNNEAPKMTPNDRQERETVLRKEQEELSAFSQEAKLKMEDKRRTLLQPIIIKIKDAVNAVAKENKYNFIFDVSAGNLLYVNDSEDIISFVKMKLNIK